MVAIPIFIYLFLIVFGILSLILFFKIWGMCNDMRALKDFVTARFSLERHNPVKHDNAGMAEYDPISDKRGEVLKTGEMANLNYKIYDNGIVDAFNANNGALAFSGRLKTYPGYSMCGVFLGQDLCIYKDEKCAIEALHTYSYEKRINKNGLIEKKIITSIPDAETRNDISSETLCIHDSEGKDIYYRTDKTRQKIVFIDGGKTGKINRYGNSSYTSIIDDDGTEYVYLNAQSAIIALFHYLNEGRIIDSNLYTKKSAK